MARDVVTYTRRQMAPLGIHVNGSIGFAGGRAVLRISRPATDGSGNGLTHNRILRKLATC